MLLHEILRFWISQLSIQFYFYRLMIVSIATSPLQFWVLLRSVVWVLNNI